LTIESEFPGQEMLYLGIIKAVGEDTLSIKAVDSAGVWQKLAVNLPLNAITQIHIEDKYTSLYDFGTKL
jgi:hypothetical protein